MGNREGELLTLKIFYRQKKNNSLSIEPKKSLFRKYMSNSLIKLGRGLSTILMWKFRLISYKARTERSVFSCYVLKITL